MSDDIKRFHKLYPDIKYPVWKVGEHFYLNSHKTTAEAYANATGQVVEMVEAPAKAIKGKKAGEQITTEDGTQ